MKKKCLIVLFLMTCMLASCGVREQKNGEYMQKNLGKPTRIEKERAGTSLVYGPEEEEYDKIFDTISSNWWMTTENEAKVASDSELQSVDNVEIIKTSTNNRYVTANDIIVRFIYDEPIKWEIADGEPLQIKLLAFVLSQEAEEGKNVKGYFIISETETIGENEGIYTYYYNEEIINNMFGRK